MVNKGSALNNPGEILKQKVSLDAEDQKLVRALMDFSFRFLGMLPVITGSTLLIMGLALGLMVLFIKAAVAIIIFMSLLVLIGGLFSLFTGLKVMRKRIPYYRNLLAGQPKTVVSGLLQAVRVEDKSHIYWVGNGHSPMQLRVWIPLGHKYFKFDSYAYSSFSSLLNEMIRLHFISLLGGKNILLKVSFPDYPGFETSESFD